MEGLPRNAILCVQEAARGKAGWQQISKGSWTTVLHRHTAAWRGSGIVFHEAAWRVMRKKATERGTWFRVRHVEGTECWVGTAHFTPGTTQPVHAAEVSDHLQSLPATTLPVLLGCDVNSEVSWGLDDQGDPVVAPGNGKTLHFFSACQIRGLCPAIPAQEDFRTPTSRPRQQGKQGKQIDTILAARVKIGALRIYRGSHLALGTDHECLGCDVTLTSHRPCTVYATRPRVWVGGVQGIEGDLDQARLAALAKQCTKPKPSSAYQDSEETKAAFAQARRLRTGEAWTQARNLRKKARRLWEQQRLVNATSGNWSAYKDLKQRGNQGWDSCFAEAQGDTDPHEVIHTHLEKLYTTGDVIPPLPAWDGPVEDFTLAELRFVLTQGKKGKAVGTDGTSQELFCGIAELPGGGEALLDFFSSTGCIEQQ